MFCSEGAKAGKKDEKKSVKGIFENFKVNMESEADRKKREEEETKKR